MHADNMQAHEIHTDDMYAHEVHVYKVYTLMQACEMHAHETYASHWYAKLRFVGFAPNPSRRCIPNNRPIQEAALL
jgi:hypothetical protein